MARKPDGRPVTVTARSLHDYYQNMFALDDADLAAGPVLDCPARASSFAAQARARGGRVISADPVYSRSLQEITGRVRANLHRAPQILAASTLPVNWDYLGSPEAYIRASHTATGLFAADYARQPRWYVAAALPRLPFKDRSFRLTLSSHLLFIYSGQLSYAAHLAALTELTRVTSSHVRVHPLTGPDGAIYPRLGELRAALASRGIATEIRPVPPEVPGPSASQAAGQGTVTALQGATAVEQPDSLDLIGTAAMPLVKRFAPTLAGLLAGLVIGVLAGRLQRVIVVTVPASRRGVQRSATAV